MKKAGKRHERLAARLGLGNELSRTLYGKMSVREFAELVNTPLRKRGVEPAAYGFGVNPMK
jgi:hypothetical protein